MQPVAKIPNAIKVGVESRGIFTKMPAFGLNQMTMAHATPIALMDAAAAVGCVGVELRNDLEGGLFAGLTPEVIGAEARARGLQIMALAEVYAFNDNSAETRTQVADLATKARICGAQAIVLIPRVGDEPLARPKQRASLRAALDALLPICAQHGITALIEPLGFANSTLRYKADVVAVLSEMGNPSCFGLIHDTFHHALAGEEGVFAEATQVVHISGVADQTTPLTELTDAHRALIGPVDRLQNIHQISALRDAGFDGPFSFEAFAPDVHALSNPTQALRASTDFITSHLADQAA